MKKWTVMLIPHSRGNRRSFEVNLLHGAMVAVLVAAAAVGIATYIYNQPVTHAATDAVPPPDVAEPAEALDQGPSELAFDSGPLDTSKTLEINLRDDLEASIRAEYEARDEVITSELNRLYELETQVRERMGMPPHDSAADLSSLPGGGQGGPPEPAVLGEFIADSAFAPPNFIHGVDRPSADLMWQEMRMRVSSLRQLVSGMEVRHDQLARIPSIVPTDERNRKITSGFGNRRDPFTRRTKFHSGIDIATVHGAAIQATARGVVVESDRDGYYGNYVRIDHGNGYETLFGHMSKRVAEVGQEVERGDLIGKVGSTGRSTSPHIHYEVLKDGERVNPRNFLGQ